MNQCYGFLIGWTLIALFAGCASIEFSFPDSSESPAPIDNFLNASSDAPFGYQDNVLLASGSSGQTIILQSNPLGQLLNFTIETDGGLCYSTRVTLTVNGQEVYYSVFAKRHGPTFYSTAFAAHADDEISVSVTSARESHRCFSSGKIWWRITD